MQLVFLLTTVYYRSHLVPRKNPDMKRTFHFLTVFILFFMHGQSCTLQEKRCTLGARYERAPNFLCPVLLFKCLIVQLGFKGLAH